MSDTIHPDPTVTDQQQQPDRADSGADANAAQSPDVASAPPASRLTELASGHTSNPTEGRETVFELDNVTVSYSGKRAIRDDFLQAG